MRFLPFLSPHGRKDRPKTTVALFVQGGGMRGLVPAHLMTAIEERTGLRMAQMVDILAGPSTGAILNAALTRPHPDKPDTPLYRARHLVRFYEREGENIFPPDRFRALRGIIHDFNNRTLRLGQLNALFRHGHYDPANLGRALKALYGDTKLSDSLTSLVIPTYNIDGDQVYVAAEKEEDEEAPAPTINNFYDHGGHAVWLKNIRTGHPTISAKRTPDISLYDAVMASCAAPTFFPCHNMQVKFADAPSPVRLSCIDGVIFDNPCISYHGAIKRHTPPDHQVVLIVLGTGYTNFSVKREDWNRYGALGIVDPVNDLPLINIFFHASESALIDAFAQDMGENLFVFNRSMLNCEGDACPNTQIDDASPENLKALSAFAQSIIEQNETRFDALCRFLVKHYEQKQGAVR